MNEDLEDRFMADLNQNIGIVHRVCNIYFIYDREEREDLFQEITYQAWKSFAGFKGQSKFSTWMYRIALNTAITHLRKSKRRPDLEKLSEKHEQVSEDNEQKVKDEQMNFLYAAINTLSDVNKAIIFLYLEDHSYEEIASITGLTKTNVSVRILRIKKLLEEKSKKNL